MIALEQWPDGKEKLSTDTVANISDLLRGGLSRWTSIFSTAIMMRSPIRPVK